MRGSSNRSRASPRNLICVQGAGRGDERYPCCWYKVSCHGIPSPEDDPISQEGVGMRAEGARVRCRPA